MREMLQLTIKYDNSESHKKYSVSLMRTLERQKEVRRKDGTCSMQADRGWRNHRGCLWVGLEDQRDKISTVRLQCLVQHHLQSC